MLDFPLVWVEVLQNSNENIEAENAEQLTVKILAPEYELHVTFPDGEVKASLSEKA